MDFNPTPFAWLPAVLTWLLVCGAGLLIVGGATLFGLLVSRGVAGVKLWAQELGGMLVDITSLSCRRVWAITLLTFKEAVRRKALLVGVVFALLFMFAGWFLSGSDLPPEFQVKVYVSFVLRAISWMILPVVLLLSCWAIPEDIRLRSLHTVVTKPARRLEVVLGRVVGFSLVGTLVLVLMAFIGWVSIERMMPKEAKAQLTCRQPIFGDLTFRDREGNDKDPQGEALRAGINVGDTWEFHSYIEGATKARAMWLFDGVTADKLDADGNLQLENRFLAFRSYKGDMRRSLYFQYVLVNPETGLRVPTQFKTVNEFRGRTDKIPRSLPRYDEAAAGAKETGGTKAVHDLLADVVSSKGQLLVEVLCIDPNQYIGMSRPDLFVRTPDTPFWSGYVKAVLCIEMMMLLVILLGVTASTFAKGPIATMLTFCLILIGLTARDFMGRLVADPDALAKAAQYAGQQQAASEGGGVFESIYRILTHMNPSTPLPEGPATAAMKGVDGTMLGFLWLVHQIIPNFEYFSRAMKYLAEGFDVRWDSAVLPSIAITLAYVIPCLLLGHFVLRVRELESK
jgi:hypothetical protein